MAISQCTQSLPEEIPSVRFCGSERSRTADIHRIRRDPGIAK
jgi:hypothetical protein